MEKHNYVYDETIDSVVDKEDAQLTGPSYPLVVKGICCTLAVLACAMIVAFFKGAAGRKQAAKMAAYAKKNAKCPLCPFLRSK